MLLLREQIKNIELFIKGSNFYKGLRLTFSVLTPLVVLYFFGLPQFSISIVTGAFLNAPGDIPGSLKRKVNAILISTGLTMLITIIILFLKPIFPVLVIAIALISFFVSLLSVYGFRASLVSFSGLLAMVLAFAVQKETVENILLHAALMGIGGLWYLLVSFTFQKLAPKKDNDQLLSDTLQLIGQYLKVRARLLTKVNQRELLMQQAMVLQTQINDKHETLREVLFASRRRSGRSHYDEKQLLIFLSTVNIFELIEAKHIDYQEIDRIFHGNIQFLKASTRLNKILGNHLIILSEVLIQHHPLPEKESLLNALTEANTAINVYVEDIKLPRAREGALVLQNLYDYQALLVDEVRAIRRVMADVKDSSIVSLKRQDGSNFLTLQEYNFNVLTQNFSFNSNLFRHSLRLSSALVFAYILGSYLDIHNSYWILLTIVVIMRPNYGLTRERSKDRIVGTLIGAAVAISIVLLTQNIIFYGVCAIISLTLAFALIQQNYRSAAAFVTINIIFVYSLMNPNAFEVIQYRVVDTMIGALIAVVANYILWPSWEVYNLKLILLNALKKNQTYLLATKDLYHNKDNNELPYKIARKEVFLAISNLNAAFQRLTQDPKSKQKEFRLIYELVTLNQTMVSAIASIGSFIINHQTTPASREFDILILKIVDTLQQSIELIDGVTSNQSADSKLQQEAQNKLNQAFQTLSLERDANLEKGNFELKTEDLHHLQEAYLLSNQFIWLKSLSENLNKAMIKYNEAF